MTEYTKQSGAESAPRSGRTEAGFTFVELMIAFSVAMLGLLAIGALTMTLYGGTMVNDEKRTALHAAQAQLERMKTYDFREIFVSFDTSKDNDPAAGAVGAVFDVVGLEPVPGAPGGKAGRVIFPVGPPPLVSTTKEPVLREDVKNATLGLPRDLDGDGTIDSKPKDTTYIHLPVIVEVRWQGRLGPQATRLVTWLTPTEEIKP